MYGLGFREGLVHHRSVCATHKRGWHVGTSDDQAHTITVDAQKMTGRHTAGRHSDLAAFRVAPRAHPRWLNAGKLGSAASAQEMAAHGGQVALQCRSFGQH